MALQKLELRPGVNKESTTYANEGGFFAGDKIRFRSGFAEKLGGWINYSPGNTFVGIARSMWNWVTHSGNNLLAMGTNLKYYLENGGVYYDITPLQSSLNLSQNPFSTTNGSYLVTVTESATLASIGTYVTFSGVSNSGTVNGINLDSNFQIVSVPSANTYVIAAPNTANATGTGGGSLVISQLEIPAGNAVYAPAVGWGAPPWGAGGWGSATAVGVPMRLWSQDNLDEDLVFAYRNGPIYWWTQNVTTYPRALLLSTVANSEVKTSTTATAASGATTITVADPTGIDIGSVVSGTGIPSGAYVTTSYTGGVSVPISVATTSTLSISNVNFSYSGRAVPTETLVVFTSSVGNFTIALGATPYDATNFTPAFDPLLVRWSDYDNPFEWVPATTNQSGEQHLSNGSTIVAAVDTRQEILIWTDSALFSMQYLGPPYVWGFNLLMENISIASQNAAITVNNVTYWMGVDKFYMYSGRVETLPCSLRQFVFTNINKTQIAQVVSGTNEGYNEVWWFYPSKNSQVNDSYVIYNHLERLWYYGTMNRTAWLDSPLRSYPMAVYSIQNTYLDQAINSSATTITVLNGLSYPATGVVQIGSEKIAYTGISGNSLLNCTRGYESTTAASHSAYAAVTLQIPNQVVYHEYANDDQLLTVAAPIESYIETSDFDIQDGQTFGYVWRILPDLTFDNSTSENPSVMLTVKPRQNSGSNYTSADTPTVTRTAQYPVEQYTGQVYTRVRGRQMAFRVDSTDLGVAWQMGMMRIDVRPDGRR
ncbi:hypothetical protein EBZ39_03770 [bacterium]|nr:hypothetical protein [bacterium]